jgi:hypothetical protein
MNNRPDPPCDCDPEFWVGTISAGDSKSAPFTSVVTCADHVKRSAGYVQMCTGLDANPLLTWEEARKS